MKIFAKKAFALTNTETGEEVITRPLEIQDVPDWAAKTDMFKLASQSKDIQGMNTKNEEKKAEQEATKAPAKNKNAIRG